MARNSNSLEVRLGDYGFTPPHLEYGRKPLPKDHYGLGPVRSDPDWFTHGGFSSQEAMDFARRLGFSTAQELRKFADTFGFMAHIELILELICDLLGWVLIVVFFIW